MGNTNAPADFSTNKDAVVSFKHEGTSWMLPAGIYSSVMHDLNFWDGTGEKPVLGDLVKAAQKGLVCE